MPFLLLALLTLGEMQQTTIPTYRVQIEKNGVDVIWDPHQDMTRDECLARLKTFKPEAKATCVYKMVERQEA